jgi:hypothetical protein
MSNNEEERWVKARLDRDMNQHYHRISCKKTMSRKELSRAGMTIEGAQVSHGEEESSDEDVEDETHVSSPRALHHGEGNNLAGASGIRSTRDQLESEDESKHGDEAAHIDEEEIFDVEEIIPQAYVHMGTPSFQQRQNSRWRQKISYKGNTEVVREKRRENPKLHAREATDYRFHTSFSA